MSKKLEFSEWFKNYRQKVISSFSLKWSKWGRFRKFFVIFSIFFGSLFILFWISSAALFTLPVITSIYFCTWIVKNILDIIDKWKWDSIFSKPKDEVKEREDISALVIVSEDDGSIEKTEDVGVEIVEDISLEGDNEE